MNANKPSLGQYVRHRNGVPLGASGSMGNMLRRSLGAKDFSEFWQFWNPVWGYYLGYFIFRPLHRYLHYSAAIILTFAVSGALHDLAVMLLKWKLIFFFTPWFTLMGATAILTKALGISFAAKPFVFRAMANIVFIIATYWLASTITLFD